MAFCLLAVDRGQGRKTPQAPGLCGGALTAPAARPHPGAVLRRNRHLENAADHDAVLQHAAAVVVAAVAASVGAASVSQFGQSSPPALLRLAPHRWRVRVLELEPVGASGRSGKCAAT